MNHLMKSVLIGFAFALSNSAQANDPPAEGIVIYEWAGTVSDTGWIGDAYGISIGDQAKYTLTLLDDIYPNYASKAESLYSIAWLEIEAGTMGAIPDPMYNIVGGDLTMRNNTMYQGSLVDRILTSTFMESSQYGYLSCYTTICFDPSAFESNDLILSTPSVPVLPLFPNQQYSMVLRNASNYLIAESVFDTFTVTHIPEAADVNADAVVDVQDLLAVISAFGNPYKSCEEDVNEDGAVNIQDLLAVISTWDQ